MRKNLQTAFSTRQYMVAQDFEIYYYNEKIPEQNVRDFLISKAFFSACQLVSFSTFY